MKTDYPSLGRAALETLTRTTEQACRVQREQLESILRRNAHTAEGSPSLWNYAVENFIRPQIDRGHLRDDLSINEKSTEDKVGF